MARYNEKRITYPTQEKLMDWFCGALCELKGRQAIRNFLKDLLNRQERLMLVRRLQIADMLLQGATYKDIIDRLHCGPATVSRVERWLHFGRGGYLEALTGARMLTKEQKRKKTT